MNDTKKFNLPPLPYGENDLSPIISSDTIQLHYGKHHQAYFNMLNTLAEGTKYNEMSLENVVVESFKDKEQKIILSFCSDALLIFLNNILLVFLL